MLLAGRAVLAHVLGVRPRHGLLLWAVPARTRSPPGRVVLGPGQKYGPTGSGYMDIYNVGSANPLFSTEDTIEANRFMKGIEAVAGDSRGEMYVTSFGL